MSEPLSAQEAAARIQKQVICVHLAAAIDDWAPSRRASRDQDDQSWKRLISVAREADPDPWRLRLRDLLASRDATGAEELAAAAPIDTLPATTLSLLAAILCQGGIESAVDFLKQAQGRFPADFWINHQLGSALQDRSSPNLEEAIGFHRAALAARPESPPAHFSLGRALAANNKLHEAIAQYREALRLKTDYPEAHFNLGNALAKKPGCLDEAIAEYREAIRVGLPSPADASYNLGNTLMRQKRADEAIEAYWESIRINSKNHKAFFNLGNALREAKRLDEAVTAFERANRLKETPECYTNLGVVFGTQKKFEEAIRAFRNAIRLKPQHASAHSNLGLVFRQQGERKAAIAAYRDYVTQIPERADSHYKLAEALHEDRNLDEAIAEFRKALALKQDDVNIRYNLGLALAENDKPDEAIAEYREVLQRDPNHAEAHCNLGAQLQRKGQFAEAAVHRRRGHELGSKQPGWEYPSARWLQEAERLVELDARLPRILEGQATPANNAERIELARMCQRYKRLYAAATRFYEEAFAAAPKLADDSKSGLRYDAACAAALAGCGQGEDAKALNDERRAQLRGQALSRLLADLQAHRKQLDSEPDKAGPLVQRQMQHWQRDPDLAAVRTSDGLAKLPESERRDWQKLWKDVGELSRKAQALPKVTPKR